MADPALLVLMAATLSASAVGVFARLVSRLDASGPDRLIGELRLAQWAALLLATTGALSIGLAVGTHAGAVGNFDVTIGVGFVILAGIIVQSEPRTALRLVVAGFVAHALFDIAHRPGWLSPEIVPRTFAVGSAIYDVGLAAMCYLAGRR